MLGSKKGVNGFIIFILGFIVFLVLMTIPLINMMETTNDVFNTKPKTANTQITKVQKDISYDITKTLEVTIKCGMNQDDVTEVLGEPTRISSRVTPDVTKGESFPDGLVYEKDNYKLVLSFTHIPTPKPTFTLHKGTLKNSNGDIIKSMSCE